MRIDLINKSGRGSGGYSGTTTIAFTSAWGSISNEVLIRARRMLARIGYSGKNILYSRFLKGQELRLNKKTASDGRRTFMYRVVGRTGEVVISSFPLNLFETGRTLRSGRREPGKFVFSQKLPPYMRAVIRRQGIKFNLGL